MPPLDRATRDALTESIREHGVIVPVVKDQTGYVLDGHNRIRIAHTLGVDVPEVVHECELDQRDVLSVELNGARRQIRDDQWKPLVDSLRAKGIYSDRVIAKAVGVSKDAVNRYKSPVSPPVAPATPGLSKRVGEDGKAYPTSAGTTAIDRALHLICKSTTGLTAADLATDEVLCQFGRSTVSKLPTQLANRGLVEAVGKRDRSTVWRAVKQPTASPPADNVVALHRKAERTLTALQDPALVAEMRAMVTDAKEIRRLEREVIHAQKAADAERLERERREAQAEKDRLRQAEIERDMAGKSLAYWERARDAIDAANEVVSRLFREFDNFPPIMPSQVRMLLRSSDGLRQTLHQFDVRLRGESNGNGTAVGEPVIDV